MMYVVALAVYLADLGVKWWVRTHLPAGQPISVWPGVLEIDYIQNPGGAFGILPDARWLFITVAVLVLAAAVTLERRLRPSAWSRFALGCLLGGAVGNMTDRVVWGNVIDYVYVRAIHFPVFNLADVAIDVGVGLLVLASLRRDGFSRRTEADRR
ncbi:lipoprotein signal peptidase [Alicyclobacillus cellulosilyticus]|uniref:Lipoprotein signal peptidase n=2 Tax=Alicyclobacillus cellulosilyticus TaxID=1003997 RepID=A0A917K194_9BACL|nr:lipoprotein signal peptidase [Alicyclobacillus cellulosilyticus]